jgi:hypothetical protein
MTLNLSELMSLALISEPQIATHTDPIFNTTVRTALFVDNKSGGTFGIDATYLENDQWWCHNPFERCRTLLAGNTPDNTRGKGSLNDDDVDPELLTLWALVQYALCNAPQSHSEQEQLLQDITARFNGILQPVTPLITTQVVPADLNGAILSLLQPLLPRDGKLYLVIPENVNYDSWLTDVKQAPETLITPEIWFDPVMFHPVSGWTQEQSDRITALDVGQALFGFGDFYHSIFRIR